jgi:hypothetical protein
MPKLRRHFVIEVSIVTGEHRRRERVVEVVRRAAKALLIGLAEYEPRAIAYSECRLEGRKEIELVPR